MGHKYCHILCSFWEICAHFSFSIVFMSDPLVTLFQRFWSSLWAFKTSPWWDLTFPLFSARLVELSSNAEAVSSSSVGWSLLTDAKLQVWVKKEVTMPHTVCVASESKTKEPLKHYICFLAVKTKGMESCLLLCREYPNMSYITGVQNLHWVFRPLYFHEFCLRFFATHVPYQGI